MPVTPVYTASLSFPIIFPPPLAARGFLAHGETSFFKFPIVQDGNLCDGCRRECWVASTRKDLIRSRDFRLTVCLSSSAMLVHMPRFCGTRPGRQLWAIF